jgi:hypothetical protein
MPSNHSSSDVMSTNSTENLSAQILQMGGTPALVQFVKGCAGQPLRHCSELPDTTWSLTDGDNTPTLRNFHLREHSARCRMEISRCQMKGSNARVRRVNSQNVKLPSLESRHHLRTKRGTTRYVTGRMTASLVTDCVPHSTSQFILVLAFDFWWPHNAIANPRIQ